jgi:hypothetical protein
MAQAQTSPKTPNMLYPGCALQAADGGPAQTHLLCRLHVPAQSPWPRRKARIRPWRVNWASRGRRLTSKPVTENNMSLCAPAQIAA